MLQSPHRHSKKEIGVLMIILAAETVADCCISKDAALSTELVASTTSTIKFVNNKIIGLDGGAFESSSTSTGGESETGFSTPTTADCADDYQAIPTQAHDGSMSSHCLGTNALVVGLIVSFLPWRKALDLRRVSRLWFEQSMTSAALLRMPATGLPAVFVPCDWHLEANEALLERQLGSTCTTDSADLRRVFLGQLRRDATVPMLKWLFDVVMDEPTALVAVENHRNRTTMRGKGCAWAYVNADVANRVLAYHRRVFFDVVAGVEGCWVVPTNNTAMLAEEIHMSGYAPQRPRHLPRNALVCEIPAAKAMEETSSHMSGAHFTARPHHRMPQRYSQVQGGEPALPTYDEALYATSGPSSSPPAYYRHNPYATAAPLQSYVNPSSYSEWSW